jgi:hypothetical protein
MVSRGGSPPALVEAQPLTDMNNTTVPPKTVAYRTRLAVLVHPLCPFCYASTARGNRRTRRHRPYHHQAS